MIGFGLVALLHEGQIGKQIHLYIDCQKICSVGADGVFRSDTEHKWPFQPS